MKSNFMIWTARLLSLLLLAGIMVLGILAYGYASDDTKVRVSKNTDTEFVIEQANILSTEGWQEKKTDSLVIPEGNIYVYTSEVKQSETDFIMTGVEVTADVPDGTSVTGKVRASDNGSDWTEWIDMDLLADDSVPPGKMFSENPVLFGGKMKYAQYSLTLSSDNNLSPEVYDVVLTNLDPTSHFEFITQGYEWLVNSVKSRETIDIVTREEWGADESIMDWDQEYAPVEQIIVHHTAGGNNAPVDPAAVIRGIYYFHAVEKEWGDIGYNYIIDQHGRIYEGRKGGLGVVGAHASGNNYGSVGIAIIGDYSNDSPSSNALKGLIELVEYISYQTDLDLSGSHDFNNNYIPVVAGHRDVNPTECPGDVLYSMLSDVQDAAANGMADLPQKELKARVIEQSADEINLSTGEINTVSVKFENSGSAVWMANKNNLKVVPVGPYPRNSGFKSSSWESSQNVGPVSSRSVMPGEEVVFNLELKGLAEDGNFVEKFALLGNNGILDNTTFSLVINNQQKDVTENDENKPVQPEESKPPVEADEVLSDASAYQAAWSGQSDNVVLYPGEEKSVWIDLKNTGEATWYRDGANPIRLGTDRDQDHASLMFVSDSGWLANNRIQLEDWQVKPGEVGRFKFTVQGGGSSGTIREYYRPVVEGLKWLDDLGIYIEVTTKEADYGASWVDQSENSLVLKTGKKARVWVELENTGDVVWRKDGNNPVRLGTDRSLDRVSSFYSQGYWPSENRAAEMKKNMVYPGDSVRFEVVLAAPDNPGVYREYFRPVVEGVSWLDDLGIYWDIVVEK